MNLPNPNGIVVIEKMTLALTINFFSFLGESETHLFRHASEITRETKGGYLKGKIIVPKSTKPCYLRLSLVPAEPDLQTNAFHLHPNLLHINLRQNKKNRNLEVSYLKLKTINSKIRVAPPSKLEGCGFNFPGP